MHSIKYVEGDLFQPITEEIASEASYRATFGSTKLHPTYLVPHVCNDRGAWGAGFVVPLGKHFPAIRQKYLEWSAGNPPAAATYPGGMGFRLGHTQVIEAHGNPRVIVFNMVAQEGVGAPRPLRYNALAACMDHVAEWKKHTEGEIRCPLFGAGLAGGNWQFIEELIKDCWLRRGIKVTVYYLPGTFPGEPPKQEA